MNKYVHTFGTAALALAMVGAPFVALAEGTRGEVEVKVSVDEAENTGARGSVSASNRESVDDVRTEVDDDATVSATGTPRVVGGVSASVKDDDDDNEDDDDGDEWEVGIKIENERPAISLADLKLRIETRKQELEDEVASTTSKKRDVLENANPVRIAVHTLLASRALLGGIGEQVSEVARQMNGSLATTTNIELKLKARGFLTRFLFGGDKDAAERLQEQLDRNQDRIDALKSLLAQANVSVELKTTLEAQLAVLEAAHIRLEALADKEDGAWGLFSWRFSRD